MRILITGGSGFIGKNLCEQLKPYYDILAPARKDLDLLDEDMVQRFFAQNDIDVVIHCAIKPGHRNAADTEALLYNNTRMFMNVARNKHRFGRMIHLGSGLEYDIRYYIPKMTEDYFDKHVPLDEAGFSKYLCAKYIESSSEDIVNLRLFGVFGKYEDYAIRFISNAICKTLFNLPVTIKQNRKFDYIYINDFIPILRYFIENKPKYRTYNVTPYSSIELYTLAQKVLRISGKDLPIKIAQEGMGAEYSGDNSRLRSEIESLEFTDMDDAISELYDWYKSNIHLIDRQKLLFDK